MSLAIAQISLLPSLAFEYRADLPPTPAVYFVLNDQRSVMYIGATENLRVRWKSHHRAPQMVVGAYRIHWTEVADADQRSAMERQAIDYFRPLWNRTEVPTDDMKRVVAYINDAARYMDVSPRELMCKILMDWAYNRESGRH